MITINLIHYNSNDLILKAIESVLQFSGFAVEDLFFTITDNSQNIIKQKLDELGINYLLNSPGYNSGFARGVNFGLRNARGEHFVLMNQDACLIENYSISKMLLKHKELDSKSIIGCNLVDEKGEFQQSIWIEEPGIVREWKKGAINCKLNPNWQKNRADKIAKAHNNSGFVNRINGAFLVFKKPKNITEVLFDEDFFLYGEDVEWAIRIKQNGWRFYHYSDIQINHIGSASSSNIKTKLNQIEIMHWLVVRKTKSKLYFQFFIFLIGFNFWLDLFLVRRKDNQSQINTVQEARNNFIYLKKKYFKLIRNFKRELFFNELNEYKNDKKNIES